ncbi:MAG: hypothetical protein HOM25_19005 [Rhodospirillaceae bacterium]|jgi:hypothetical protein|nr:hypothetical protein [Rhodospirillaceae bacterium]MBT5667240.1 hypothetical protein [Rhodospirillaceae bacterium]
MKQKGAIAWAFDDVEAARKLWPRVEEIVEAQAAEGHLKLSPAEQRKIVRAVVDDLLNNKSTGGDISSGLNSILSLFKKSAPETAPAGRSGKSMEDWLRTA